MCDCDGSGTLGGRIGGYIGSRVGNLAQTAVKRLFLSGMGAYKLKSNTLVGGGGIDASGSFDISPAGPDSIKVTKKEYLGDIYTAAATAANSPAPFNLQSFSLNPGLIETFPWLSTLAQQYEQYQMRGLVFEFRPTVSDFNTIGGLGTVMMGTEYDNLDNVWESKIEFMNAAYSNEGKPTEHVLHGVECDPREGGRGLMFVRSQVLPANADLNDFDIGRFYIATQGYSNGATPARQNIGSLFVHYDIVLLKSQLGGGILAKNIPFVKYNVVSAVAMNFANVFSNTLNVYAYGNSSLATLGGSTLTLPTWGVGGKWLVMGWYNNVSGYVASATNITCAGGTIDTDWWQPTVPIGLAIAPQNGLAGTNNSAFAFLVKQSDPTCVLTAVTFGATGTPVTGFLIVHLINTNMQ